MARMYRPPVGTKVWFVSEHLYYAGRASPELEYSVYQGEVLGYRTGNWTDVQIRYRCEEGYIKLTDIQLSASTPKIFDNPRDAALLAQSMTNDHVRRWGWTWSMWPDTPPMRRKWENYLKDGGDRSDESPQDEEELQGQFDVDRGTITGSAADKTQPEAVGVGSNGQVDKGNEKCKKESEYT